MTSAAAAAVAAAMAKLGNPAPSAVQDDTIDNLAKKVNDMRTDDRIRHSRQPGTGGFAAGNRGGHDGRRRANTREAGGAKPVQIPSSDFDFEGSNAKFNKEDLIKEAIASGSPLGGPEEANGFDLHAAPEATAPKALYNKSTSFFDNLSSEIKDRQQAQEEGKRLGGPQFRREEGKKNYDTFGQSSVDNGQRSGFRGRGRGHRGRGRGGGGNRGGRGGPATADNAPAQAQP